MSRKPDFSHRFAPRSIALGLIVLLAASVTSEAGDIGRGVTRASAAAGPSRATAGAAMMTSPGIASAKDVMTRSAAALTAVQNMQVAARNLALAGASNLGMDPNHPGQRLPDVPDGLGAGGLDPDQASNPWQGANAPTQSAANGQTIVAIQQLQQQALLYWRTFNIGKNTTLNFDQSLGGANAGRWIAFNKINDPSGRPSQILGSINALGQVYVINANGIIFGGSSQINTHALVASSLPINDNLVQRGLLNNPDLQFLFSTLPLPAGTNGTPAFTPSAIPGDVPGTPSGQYGNVEVQPGAQISSPTTPEHIGGLVALIGPNVTNAGTISTPDGQAILAAGLQVGLAAHNANDSSLRGLDAYVGAVAPYAGTAANNLVTDGNGNVVAQGLIQAPRGDVMITGKTVNQLGFIDSSTSVTLNGRIDLLAEYGAVANAQYTATNPLSVPYLLKSTGLVTLGENSVAQILPELTDTDRVAGTQLTLPSIVNLQGEAVHLASHATILAPGAMLPDPTQANPIIPRSSTGESLTAGVTIDVGSLALDPSSVFSQIYNTSGQIYLDAGATIDASGLQDVNASVAENIVAVQLLGAQLADSPLQRSGLLRGQTVNIDIRQFGSYSGQEWVGTPLAITTGYINLIQHSVGELTTGGGTVALNAGESVVMQPGSAINVSGGSIDYQGGMVATTEVIFGSHLMDISKATPNLAYNGIYTGNSTTTDAKWGVTETYTNPGLGGGMHFEQGYAQGGNGGSIAITAPSMALDGSLLGSTVAGPYQRTGAASMAGIFTGPTAAVLPTLQSILGVPMPGGLSLTFQGQQQDPDPAKAGQFETYSPLPPKIVIEQPDGDVATASPFMLDGSGNPMPLSQANPALPLRQNLVEISPDLVNVNGFGFLAIDNSDDSHLTTSDGPVRTVTNGFAPGDFGKITVAPGVTLNFVPAGTARQALNLSAANIDIQGDIIAPGGNVSFNAYDISQNLAFISTTNETVPMFDDNRGQLTVGSGVTLNTAGLTVDDRASSPTSGVQPLVTGGGQISLAGSNVALGAGSTFNVSGGVQVTAAGKPVYGQGGGLTVAAGKDLNGNLAPSILGGRLTGLSDANLVGYAGGGKAGGSLDIQTQLIQVGGATASYDPLNTLLLSPDFFNEGGFSSFTLRGLGEATLGQAGQFDPAVYVSPGTRLQPIVQNWQAAFDSNNQVTLAPTLLPQGVRTPVNLSFVGTNGILDAARTHLLTRGDVVIGPGAVIETDPQTNPAHGISLSGNTVAVLAGAQIIAPGGTIAVKGGSSTVIAGLVQALPQALPTVDLAPGSVLDASGTTVYTPDPSGRGLRTGTVLPGGTINISGNIVAEAGSTLNVSGASGVFDLAPAYSGASPSHTSFTSGSPVVPTRIDSNGGSISLAGTEELYTDASLNGAAGGSTAEGGNLTISSGRFYSDTTTPAASSDIALVVKESGSFIPGSYHGTGQAVIGNAVNLANPETGHFAVDHFTEGGFDGLTLTAANKGSSGGNGGALQFSGLVTIQANNSLTAGNGGIIFADDTVNLSAPHIALGQAFQPPQAPQPPANLFTSSLPPKYGPGSLNVTASDLIDIGNLSLQNIGAANFTVPTGDIRGDGTLDVAGAINLTAGQVYVPTAVNFTVAAYDKPNVSGSGSVIINPGSVSRPLPLSAGGTLNIYASNISQGGVLRAPIGTINLGVNGSSLLDSMTGLPFPSTRLLQLLPGSVTSVSAVDPRTGQALIIPYGTNLNGTSWIDPTGVDITVSGNGPAGLGLPAKSVNVTALDVEDQGGSIIDVTGGGDLYAYRWVPGLGGSNDILNTSSSFAVMPGYSADYMPFAPNNGYGSSVLSVGDRVYLQASNGLPAGTYTLLPARYALLPGAFLVTPQSGIPAPAVALPDGSSRVAGYTFNDLSAARSGTPILASFEVDPQSVVLARAEYDSSSANDFLRQSAQAQKLAIPRLPVDSGQLVLSATQKLNIAGSLASQQPAGGRGSLVDISSPVDMLIANQAGMANHPGFNGLVLDPTGLSNFGADSLLIGGTRASTPGGTSVAVATNHLTVDNNGAPLTGPDVILVANQNLAIAAGADIEQSGALAGPAENLQIGQVDTNGNTVVSGNGMLLRVSGDPAASTARSGVSLPATQTMTIGSGARIGKPGAIGSVTLDSTGATLLDPTATLGGSAINLGSRQISLQLGSNGAPQGLVLSSATLQTLQAEATSLSLLSYSLIDLYGSGEIGSPAFANLALHAGEIRDVTNSNADHVTFAAQNILLDNSAQGTAPAIVPSQGGSLTFDAGTIELGANQLAIDEYNNVTLKASGGILVQGAGGLTAQNDLTLITPVLTAATAAAQEITANGALSIQPSTGGSATTVAGGLGAKLSLVGGNGVVNNSAIVMPSGTLVLHATGGDVSLGSGGVLDVSGTAQTFFDLTKYTGGGQVTLQSDGGSVNLAAGSTVNVSAQSVAGNAGGLTVSAPRGAFTFTGHSALLGQAGAGGNGGTFALDVGSLPSLSSLEAILNPVFDPNVSSTVLGGFTQSQSIRVRAGDVSVDGVAAANTFALSADHGNITVTGKVVATAGQNGTIDVSTDPSTHQLVNPGTTGGTINLAASGSVTLRPGSLLTVAGQNFNDAGKGGAVSLAAGSYEATNGSGSVNTGAIVDIQPGSTIDLSVSNVDGLADPSAKAAAIAAAASLGDFTGTLHLRESQAAFGTGAALLNSLGTNIKNPSSIVLEGFQAFDLSGTGGAVATSGAITSVGSGGVIEDTVEQAVKSNGANFVSAVYAANPGLSANPIISVEPGAEIVNNGTATSTIVTLSTSSSTNRSSATLSEGANTSVTIPGGMPVGDSITVTARCTVTFADGSTQSFTGSTNTIPALGGLSGNSPVVSVKFTSASTNARISLAAGSTPFAFVSGNGIVVTSTTASTSKISTGVGDLVLANTWDLSTFRFGPNNVPGILTLRAAGNLVFNFDASLNDGFDPSNPSDASKPLWTAQLLPAGSRSWSYNLVAGADLTAADFRRVLPLPNLAANTGSVLLGEGGLTLPTATGNSVTRAIIVPQFYQVIRTGTGDIDISAGRDVQLLNPLATIYTAGTQAPALGNFDQPNTFYTNRAVGPVQQSSTTPVANPYPAQYSLGGGNVTIFAQNDIIHQIVNADGSMTPDSSKEMPTNWLYRRGYVDPSGQFFGNVPTSFANNPGQVASTSWWIDFSNFFQGVGALGGGNVVLSAGNNVTNVDAVVPTNARMTKQLPNGDRLPTHQVLTELGGGDLVVDAGRDIDGGVYYVERGTGILAAGGSVHTNATRSTLGTTASDPTTWLPTTLFLGKGSFDVSANGDVLLGSIANPFLLPQGINNSYFLKSYFSTFASTDSLDVSSVDGDITFKEGRAFISDGSLAGWYANVLVNATSTLAGSQPWLRLVETGEGLNAVFTPAATLLPGTLKVTAFSGNINLVNSFTVAPSATGTLDLVAAQSVNGLRISNLTNNTAPHDDSSNPYVWSPSTINFSDADPGEIPGVNLPNGLPTAVPPGTPSTLDPTPNLTILSAETGATSGANNVLQTKQKLHADLPLDPTNPNSPLGPLHAEDTSGPVHLYAADGDISGLTLFSAKSAQVAAGNDITDIGLYVQNVNVNDISSITAGRDLVAYDPTSTLRLAALELGNVPLPDSQQTGDIQISGPGTLEVLAGRNLNLGISAANSSPDGTLTGITSIGQVRNPALPFAGADVIVGAGIGSSSGLDRSKLGFAAFIDQFLTPTSSYWADLLPKLQALLPQVDFSAGLPAVWSGTELTDGEKQFLAPQILDVFYLVLRDAGRDFNNPASPSFKKNYNQGFAAIAALFPGKTWQGDITLTSREIKTESGGDINVFAPGGQLTVGLPVSGGQAKDQGILTDHGGNISIFTKGNVNVGVSRIFTFRGGDEIIWSSTGNIAAGSASKTVQSAPPTSVQVDPQSANVEIDLAGLATGGGIGTLQLNPDVPPANIDLIAPAGFVDAGDAGIKSSGRLNIAAVQVLNASNISAAGTVTGTPAPPAAPNVASIVSASNSTSASSNAAAEVAKQGHSPIQQQVFPSIITVEVLGYGGGDS